MLGWFMVAVFDDDDNNVHESCGGAFDLSMLGEDSSRDRDDAVDDVTWMVSGSFP